MPALIVGGQQSRNFAYSMPSAVITGVNGQDGSYLAEFLLSKGYRVAGTVRNLARNTGRIAHICERIEIIELDGTDSTSLEHMLRRFLPDEVYNLAARASGSGLWIDPALTGEVNALHVTRLLEAIRNCDTKIRFCQASSSEVFGNALDSPQDEATAFRPRNPYGAAKAYAHWITANYREGYGLFAGSCILFNHESPRRTIDFVTRKITYTVARIKLGLASELRLGNLEAKRDWGFAGDYVQAMWLMLQQPTPDDYVIATGETHSVREFCEIAFSHVGLDYRNYVTHDRENLRLAETALLVGNPAKARRLLGWQRNVSFQELVRMMMDSDLRLIQDGRSK
jgi:GDPmannose 4,6-dehydratase